MIVAVASGIVIGIVGAIITEKKTKKLKKALVDANYYNNLLTRIVLSQFDRPDGAQVYVPEELATEFDAYIIMKTNGM